MRTVLSYVVAALLLAPATALASPVTFKVSEGGDLQVSFGLAPFEISSSIEFVDTGLGGGSISLISGPLLAQEFYEDAEGEHFTRYAYGSGVVTLDFLGEALDGTPRHGTFTATTLPFEITVREDFIDIFDGAPAFDFEIELGEGRFDSALASLFHVRRLTSGGDLALGLEDIDGDPDELRRFGFDHRGYAFLEIDAVAREVPEPSALALALCGAVWMIRRKSGSIQ